MWPPKVYPDQWQAPMFFRYGSTSLWRQDTCAPLVTNQPNVTETQSDTGNCEYNRHISAEL